MLTTACLCLLLGQWSHHINRDHDYNEVHNLIGVEYQNVFALHFKNSFGDESNAIGYRFVQPYAGIQLGAKIGAVQGYGSRLDWWSYGNIAPFFTLDATVPIIKNIALEFNLIPANGGAVSAGFRIKLK